MGRVAKARRLHSAHGRSRNDVKSAMGRIIIQKCRTEEGSLLRAEDCNGVHQQPV